MRDKARCGDSLHRAEADEIPDNMNAFRKYTTIKIVNLRHHQPTICGVRDDF